MIITIQNVHPKYVAAWQEWGELVGHMAGISKLTIDPLAKRPKNSAMVYFPYSLEEMLDGFGNTAKRFQEKS